MLLKHSYIFVLFAGENVAAFSSLYFIPLLVAKIAADTTI
jgi:hypothetical protein